MIAEMVSTTNKQFEYLINVPGTFTINVVAQLQHGDVLAPKLFITSNIMSLKYSYKDSYVMVKVKTRNSIYKFKITSLGY